MRVLQVTNGFPPTAITGTESHTYTLAKQLAASHSVHVLCREADLTRPEYTVVRGSLDGLPVTRVVNNLLDVKDYEDLYRNRRVEQIFMDVLDAFRPDLIHFQHCIGLSAGCIEQAIARRLPFVVTLHDYWHICPTTDLLRPGLEMCPGTHHGPNCFDCVRLVPGVLGRAVYLPGYSYLHRAIPPATRYQVLTFLGRIRTARKSPGSPVIQQRADYMRGLLARSPRLIAPSEYVKNKYVEFGIPSDLIRVIQLGMDTQRWLGAPRHTRLANLVRLGYVGALTPQKGGEAMIRAFIQSPGAAELVIYGVEPPGQVLAARLKRLAAGDPRIHFMGPIPNERLPLAFGEMDALLMPTLAEETFSLVVREALLSGLPVIASDKGVIPEIVQDGVNGRLLPAGDVDAWTACLRDLIEHPDQLDRLKPRHDSLRVRSHADNAQDNLAIYDQVLQAHHAR